jgi:hypothetical protein
MRLSQTRVARLFLVLVAVYISIGAILMTRRDLSIVSRDVVLDRNIIKYDKTVSIGYKNPNKITILFWTEFFGSMNLLYTTKTQFQKYGGRYEVTGNKSEIETADIVVFHFLDLWFWQSLPKYRDDNQIWILFVVEPPPHIYWTGLNVPNMVFNWTMSYRRDSDLILPYGQFAELTPKEKISNKRLNLSVSATKTKMIASVISNCVDDARRYRHVSELKKYLPIDEYGECGNLDCPRNAECNKIVSKYRFKIAFENSNCRDYVSDKFYSAIAYNLIPIVNWKGEQIVDTPPNSYINIHDFKNMKELGDYLIKLSHNNTLYDSYFEWKRHYKLVTGDMWSAFPTIFEKVLRNRRYQAQVIVNPWAWIENDSCQRWSVCISIIYTMDLTN